MSSNRTQFVLYVDLGHDREATEGDRLVLQALGGDWVAAHGYPKFLEVCSDPTLAAPCPMSDLQDSPQSKQRADLEQIRLLRNCGAFLDHPPLSDLLNSVTASLEARSTESTGRRNGR